MKITLSSTAWEDVGKTFSDMSASLKTELSASFSEAFYGADVAEFQAVLIAVDSAVCSNQNEKFAKDANRSGSFKHPLTGERIKYISFAIEYRHEDLEGKDEFALRKTFCTDLFKRLDIPAIKIPTGFDYPKFALDMKKALKKYL